MLALSFILGSGILFNQSVPYPFCSGIIMFIFPSGIRKFKRYSSKYQPGVNNKFLP